MHDVASVLTKSWRLLVFLPTVAAIMTFIWASNLPQTYSSSAQLGLAPADLLALRGNDVLETVADRIEPDLVRESLMVADAYPMRTDGQFVDGRSDVSLALAVREPEIVRALLNSVVDAFAAQVGDQKLAVLRDSLETQRAGLLASVGRDEGALLLLQVAMENSDSRSDDDIAAIGHAYLALSNDIEVRREKAAELQQLMERVPTHVILSRASNAVSVGRDPALLYGIATFILVSALTSVFILAQAGIKRASADRQIPEAIRRPIRRRSQKNAK